MVTSSAPVIIELPGHVVNTSAELLELQAQVYHEARLSNGPMRQLMTWLLDRRNLHAAAVRVVSTEGANTPGVDGQTGVSIAKQQHAWLAQLADDLYHCRYQPKPPRWVDIPKPKKPNETRTLGILTLRDRVVHVALKQILEPILESEFLPTSFAFRPGRSVPSALHEALGILRPTQGDVPTFTYAAHLDVANCFDTIDHALLRAELARHIADPVLMTLLDTILQVGGQNTGRFWWRRRQGIVQGSPLSPLLCNLHLHPLDVALSDLSQATQNGVRMLRYADDLLLLARDAKTADRGITLVRQVLARMHQSLGKNNSSAVPIEVGVEWLGVRLQPRPHRWTGRITFGYVIPDAKVVSMLERITEMTTPPSEKIECGAFNPARWIVSINEQLRDWRQVYRFADNATEVFRVLDDHTRYRVGGLLQSITATNWSQMKKQYRVKLPRGFWTWEVPGARLVVLSSLAPQAPFNLIRQPPWMAYVKKLRAQANQHRPLALPAPSADLPALPPPDEADTAVS